MKLDPNATQENEFPLLKNGRYEFEVENATRAQSKSKNMYWKLQLRVDLPDGSSYKVWENLTETTNMQWKFNQYFKSVGYVATDTDEIPNTIGMIGTADIAIEPAKGEYKAKNIVKSFIEKTEDLPF